MKTSNNFWLFCLFLLQILSLSSWSKCSSHPKVTFHWLVNAGALHSCQCLLSFGDFAGGISASGFPPFLCYNPGFSHQLCPLGWSPLSLCWIPRSGHLQWPLWVVSTIPALSCQVCIPHVTIVRNSQRKTDISVVDEWWSVTPPDNLFYPLANLFGEIFAPSSQACTPALPIMRGS